VLDEPTAGVDVELRQSLWAFIRRLNEEGHTVMLTTHYLEEAESLCGRVILLKSGRVLADEPTEALLQHPDDSLETVFLRMLKAHAAAASV
jgi:ABC-2 type transport system ATP-binding protein